MKPLRIVVVMIEPPLPFGNAAARWYYVLFKGLVERGHYVTAFAACSKPSDFAEARRLFPAPAYDLRLHTFSERRTLGTRWKTLREPYSYLFAPELRQELNAELSRDFDILHLEQTWSGWLGLAHCQRSLLNIRYLFDIDLAALHARSPAEFARRLLTRRAEHRLLRQYPMICTLSPRLSAHVRRVAPMADVHTVALGLDLSLYPFSPAPRQTGRPVIGLIGSFHWHPTRSAGIRLLTRLWPLIKQRLPAARLQIVGWGARTALSAFVGLPDVEIHENVGDSIPYFLSTDVLLYAPTQGSGMKVKVLEAFALGVPVVTNQDGVEGIAALDGVHAGVSEDDAGLIERTLALLNNPKRQERQRHAARALLTAHCSPDVTLTGVEAVYTRLLSSRIGPSSKAC